MLQIIRRVSILHRSQAVIMPCEACGHWMGAPGVPPWAFPVVRYWPPLAAGGRPARRVAVERPRWPMDLPLHFGVRYRKWMRAVEDRWRAAAGG